MRNGLAEMKIPSSQRQGFIQPGTGIPQGIDECMLLPVRQVVEKRGDFRREQVLRQLRIVPGHLTQRECTALVKGRRLTGVQQGRGMMDKSGQTHYLTKPFG